MFGPKSKGFVRIYEYGCRSEIVCEAAAGALICPPPALPPDDLCFPLEPGYHPIASSYRVDEGTGDLLAAKNC